MDLASLHYSLKKSTYDSSLITSSSRLISVIKLHEGCLTNKPKWSPISIDGTTVSYSNWDSIFDALEVVFTARFWNIQTKYCNLSIPRRLTFSNLRHLPSCGLSDENHNFPYKQASHHCLSSNPFTSNKLYLIIVTRLVNYSKKKTTKTNFRNYPKAVAKWRETFRGYNEHIALWDHRIALWTARWQRKPGLYKIWKGKFLS